ncbi:MAG TPA: hypothetical protein PKE29_18765 [Phycisphaerales bacterium]|nr:hypothetical protein [Phycisphaerales bacterium]
MARKKVVKKSSAKKASKVAKRAGGVKKKATKVKSRAKAPAAAAAAGAPAFPGSPMRISTGKGATPEQVGREVVAAFNGGQYEINTRLWSGRLECIEGGGLAWRGFKNVQAKNSFWNAANMVLGASAEGPYVGSTGFAIKFKMDVEDKATGRRTIMEEVGVYTVRDGQIVREEFMYGTVLPAEAAMPPELAKV